PAELVPLGAALGKLTCHLAQEREASVARAMCVPMAGLLPGILTSDMKRRAFITLLGGAAAAWPLTVRAQQGERVRRIAWFGLGRADVPSPYLDSLRAGLRERGWIDGRNLTIGMYWATGQQDMD